MRLPYIHIKISIIGKGLNVNLDIVSTKLYESEQAVHVTNSNFKTRTIAVIY